MSTPPPVSQDEAAAAVARITARRAGIDDPSAWHLTDDLLETLVYLRKFSSGVPQPIAEADVLDGLVIRLRLWWLGEEAELWLLERARRLGVPPRMVGATLGITSRQGVHDRLRLGREKVQLLTGTPHPGLHPHPDPRERQTESDWLAKHRVELRDIASTAVAHRDLADDEAADWLVDVARDLREAVSTPGSLQMMRFALAELGTSAAVVALHAEHPLLETLSRWSRLYETHPHGDI